MNAKPRIIDYVLIALSALCFAAALIFLVVRLPSLPDRIPTHYTGSGEIDGWGGKGSVALVPAISFVLLVTMTLLVFLPKLWNTLKGIHAQRVPQAVRASRTMICAMSLEMQLFFAAALVHTVRCEPLPEAIGGGFVALLGVTIAAGLVGVYRKK